MNNTSKEGIVLSVPVGATEVWSIRLKEAAAGLGMVIASWDAERKQGATSDGFVFKAVKELAK